MKTYRIGYSGTDDFTETEFDVKDMVELFNLFINYAIENNFLNNLLVIEYIEEVEDNYE